MWILSAFCKLNAVTEIINAPIGVFRPSTSYHCTSIITPGIVAVPRDHD